MCFSATASFAAAAVLLPAGAVAIKKAYNKPTIYFATIPLFFGIQQTIEGLQWLVDKPSCTSTTLGYGFLFFAFLLWPFYIPYATMMMERDAKRRKLLRGMTWLGAFSSGYLLFSYLTVPLSIHVLERSIVYDIDIPLEQLGVPLYLVAVSASLLSTRPRAKLLGITTIIGCTAAFFAYQYAFTSVWCFFAALLSVVVLAEIFAPEKRR